MKRTSSLMILALILAPLIVLGQAFAEPGKITLTPSENDTRGPVLNVIKPFEVRLETDIAAAKTATMSLIRAGRPVGGEIPLRKVGTTWTGKAKLEFPGAHILTVRLFEGKRIWSAAIDARALEPDAKAFPATSSAVQDPGLHRHRRQSGRRHERTVGHPGVGDSGGRSVLGDTQRQKTGPFREIKSRGKRKVKTKLKHLSFSGQSQIILEPHHCSRFNHIRKHDNRRNIQA
jgi:hypothetical protein